MRVLSRNAEAALLEALADRPVVLLHGARQTGKTTLARALAAGVHPARYVTLDDAAMLAAAQADAPGFVAGLDSVVVLDEVQRAPEIFLALKAAVDQSRRPGRFLLTGSANVLFLPRLADTLAGRMEILTLWPLSQGEIAGVVEGFIDAAFGATRPALDTVSAKEADPTLRILRGGYPEPLTMTSERRRQAWFGSYATTILQRDVRELSNVEGLSMLPRLLALLASRSLTLLNYADLARASGLPQSTLKRYIAVLEATFLVRVLPAWYANLGKRIVKAPKILLTDTGLIAHLLGLDRDRLRRDRNLLGSLLETFVVMELTKQLAWSRVRPALYHYRTHTGEEVDIVLEHSSGRLVALEVKAAASVGGSDFKGIKAFAEATGDRFHRGVVLYTGREVVPFGARMHALPISALWRWGAVKPQRSRARGSKRRPARA